MKKITLSLIFLAIWSVGFSVNWVGINSSGPAPAKITLSFSNIDRSVVHFSIDGFNLKEVQTPRGTANTINLGESTPILIAGAPDLPKLTTSLIIPDLAEMGIRVVSSSFKDYENMEIAPSKGVIMRDVDPSTVPFEYGEQYNLNKFFPGELTGTREPFIARDLRGQTMIVYPFQYNPVTKTLRVYYDMTVELYKVSENGINPMNRQGKDIKLSREFMSVYSSAFLNSDAVMAYVPLDDYGRMLVISYGDFMNDMQPFVNWKNAAGIPTEMINVTTAGTTASAIKAYIANYYNTKGVTFVLLVGDAAQIPTNTGGGLGGPSDNAYGYIVGNDHYSDVFIGRFSAENVAHVQTQVQRTLEYEINPQFLADDWFTTVIGIASDQGPGDDNEYDYQHIRNQQTQLLAYTYTWNPELFDGSQGGNDEPGNPNPSKVATAVNEGAGLIIYCGHGSMTSWGTSGFGNGNVNALTNQGKLPFILSVACVNGQFNAGTCFAEAWLRATNNGQPTGAIAFLGATINQSWDSPMEGQDEMTDILAESYSNNIKRTFAGLSINGCMKMIDTYGNDGQNMADTWTVFGDPSLMVRSANPLELVVSHDSLLYPGDSTITIFSNVIGARATLTINDTILATDLVVDSTGVLTLTFPGLPAVSDSVHLVITAYNYLPYLSDIPIDTATTIDFIGYPTAIRPSDTVHFTDYSKGGITSWSWSFPGGTPDVSTEKNPVVTYSNTGTFDVQLIVGNRNGYDTLLKPSYIVVDYPTGMDTKKNGLSCFVQPNPNNGSFNLNINSFRNDIVSINLFNMLGSTIFEKNNIPVDGKLTLPVNLTNQPDGIYFLTLKGKESSLTMKVLIRK
jgi:PKD repeat protein